MDLEAKRCSKTGNLCPWVECPPCLPCQNKTQQFFKTGELEGCVLEEKCVDTGPIKYNEQRDGKCDTLSGCYAIKKSSGKESSGLYKGCYVEECVNAIKCPGKPKLDPADSCGKELKESPHKCSYCTYYTVVPRNKTTDCGELCPKWAIEDGECKEECHDYKKTSPENDDPLCKKKITSKDPETCTKQDIFIPKEAKDFPEKCIYDGKQPLPWYLNSSKPCADLECQKTGDYRLISNDPCRGMYLIKCEGPPPNPCEQLDTKICDSYLESRPCNDNEKKKCPKECASPLAKECKCVGPPVECPEEEGMARVEAECPLTSEQCANDPDCCDKKCPIGIGTNGPRKTYKCAKESCEVCATMEGAQLLPNENWLNLEYCNSDKDCCTGCKDAKEVFACPSKWSQKKKTRCGCKKNRM